MSTHPETAFERLRGAGDQARRPEGPGLVSAAAIGSTNLGRVLQALFDYGSISRAELARRIGVNRTTISGIVQPLIDEGILAEGESLAVTTKGGKPARPLCFNMTGPALGGLLLLPDEVQAALVRLDGKIERKSSARLLPGMTATEVADTLVSCARDAFGGRQERVLGVGIAVGGMVDSERNIIVKVNLAPALNGLPLGEIVNRELGMPAYLDHHPRSMLVGDRWFGQGRGRQTFAAIYTGEVLGGALYLGGQVYRGPSGAGGELGHTFVDLDGEVCSCGQRGCWETIAALPWLRRYAREAGLPEPEAMTTARLATLVAQSHPGAEAVWDRYARNLAIGIANVQQAMAPNYFVLHGDVVGGGDAMITRIADYVRSFVPARPDTKLVFVAGGMAKGEAALRGAAGLVLSGYLQFPL